ncbi:MAG: AarF/ABC1/UbiB kinase family protein [Deltaproteobacteria bacterium]|nr:AarF/ABC1/UbiB kinase family protein [Deltaproteobacteria bacterium]
MMTAADPTSSPSSILSRLAGTIDRSLTLVEQVVRRAGELARAVDRDGRQTARDAVLLWDAVVRAADEARATAGTTPRIARVLGEVARVAAAYRLFHVTSAWRDEAGRQAALEALHARQAERVRVMCTELGGGVLKVGQFLSCRADLLPRAWITELATLQDRVPPEAPDAIVALLEAELGGPLADVLPGFDPTPVAAASLAQVHFATHADRPVAVKVQRPGIGQVIAADRRAMRLVADALGTALPFDATTVLTELARSLHDELDYPAEARYAAAFREALAPLGVRVPAIHHTTDRVIIMERVDGARLTDFLDAAPLDLRDRVLEALARATAEAVLVHGLVHADPHPGNFLVVDGDDGPALALLDFGAVTTLTDEERRAYLELLPALFGGQVERAAQLLQRLGFVARDPQVPVAYAREVIGRVLASDDLSGIDPRAELERGLAMARANPDLVVPPHFVQLGRSLAGLAGLFLTYKPRLPLGRVVLETLARAPR